MQDKESKEERIARVLRERDKLFAEIDENKKQKRKNFFQSWKFVCCLWGFVLFVFVGILLLESFVPTASKETKDKKLIEAQFSSWDGSHRYLYRSIKSYVKDPDSLQHIETRYIYNKEKKSITVYCKFRAKNGFGGYNICTAMGTYDLQGNALDKPIFLE